MKRMIIALAATSILMASCKKEDSEPDNPTTPAIVLPSTYNFDNVSYDGQTARLDMLAEMTAELKKANSGNRVDSALLVRMYSNSGSPFADAALNTSGKQLKNKTYNNVGAQTASYFEYLMKRQGDISQFAGNTWSAGNAGVATRGSSAYFFDENGVEYTQIIEKGLMGAVFYYNIAEVYTRDGKIGSSVDNTTGTPGEGTDMEHHWDEAFGYFGAPIDFSATNTTDARYHAKYALKGDAAGLGTINKVMTQFIKGRYGITNKNYDYRDAAASDLRKEYEKVLVTTAIHYLNAAKSNFADDALRNHAISEAYAFIFSLAYNSDKEISNTDLASVKGYFEIAAGPTSVPSFLAITVADLNAAIDKLSSVYGLDAVKSTL
ncbi:MAG: DUF4856 domain-containing protein [Flavobacteriales bacterium]